MKAFVFTDDKLNHAVLERVLLDNEFSPVELCAPTKERAQHLADADGDALVFVDFDLELADELMVFLPPVVAVVGFGSHQARSLATTAKVKRFIAKPFSAEQVERAVAETLRAEATLPAPAPIAPTHPVLPSAEIKARWTEQLELISKRRAELERLLNATPDQLKVLLMGKVTLDDAGNPKIPLSAFPIQSALVVEQDQSFSRLITRYLAEKCVMQADTAFNGASAWQYMKGRRYDVIILQWEVQDPSGLALYNRLRAAPQTRYQPVVVISSTVKVQDFRLLDEDFAVTLVTQPVQPKAFSAALTRVVLSSVLSKEYLEALTELVRASVEAEYFLGGKAQSSPDQHNDILFSSLKLGGDRFLAQEQYSAAEAAYATAWKLGDRRLSLLTNYGKACYLGGRSKEALKLLATADVLAPKNVERLCFLGEVNLAQQSIGEARGCFHQALVIDSGVKKAHAGLEVAAAMEQDGLTEVGEEPEASPVTSFAAYLNLVGINKSRGGNLNDALRYYRSAMTFVHGQESLAKLWFNIGLCYLRGVKPELAQDAFKKAYDTSGGTYERAATYLRAAKAEPGGPAFAPAEPKASRLVLDEDEPVVADEIPFERF